MGDDVDYVPSKGPSPWQFVRSSLQWHFAGSFIPGDCWMVNSTARGRCWTHPLLLWGLGPLLGLIFSKRLLCANWENSWVGAAPRRTSGASLISPSVLYNLQGHKGRDPFPQPGSEARTSERAAPEHLPTFAEECPGNNETPGRTEPVFLTPAAFGTDEISACFEPLF